MGNFITDLKKGKEMEVRVMNLLNSNWFNLIQNPIEKEMDLLYNQDKSLGIEVKFDSYAQHSWNFYIEFECNWKPSWLLREESVELEYWAHSDWVRVFLIKWDKLMQRVLGWVEKCRANKTNKHKQFRVVENWGNWGRTKWLLVPVEMLESISDFVYTLEWVEQY